MPNLVVFFYLRKYIKSAPHAVLFLYIAITVLREELVTVCVVLDQSVCLLNEIMNTHVHLYLAYYRILT